MLRKIRKLRVNLDPRDDPRPDRKISIVIVPYMKVLKSLLEQLPIPQDAEIFDSPNASTARIQCTAKMTRLR